MKRISRKPQIYLPLFSVVCVLITAWIFLASIRENAVPVNPDDTEHQAIMKAVEDGYDALSYSYQTYDPSKLSEIFIDTPEYRLSKEARKIIEDTLGPAVARKAGYLTAMQAKTIAYARIKADMKAALDKAKAENREMSHEEFRAIIDKNNGLIPPSNLPDGNSYSKGRTIPMTFDKIEVTDDHAILYYDDGAAYQKAILLKINGKWMIGGIEPINIHF